MLRRKLVLILPLVASLGLAGCGVDQPAAPVDTARPLPASLTGGRVEIENDPAVLASRVQRASRLLTVVPKSGAGSTMGIESPKESDIGVRLTLVGEVAPPTVDGEVVQANDIVIHGKTAVVAYNMAGDPFAGAVQVIDFSRPGHPEMVSEVLYHDADVNAVALEGSHLFVGLASDDAALASPALLEELKLTGGRGLEQTGRWLDLPSWAVTDLVVHGDAVVAGVGAQDGGVVLLRREPDLEVAGFAPATDVRGVDVAEHRALTVCGGPGMLLQHDLRTMRQLSEAAVAGYGNAAAKGTIEVLGQRCYLGAGEGGFQVRAADGQLLASLACADFTAAGAPAVVNAVSCVNHLGFVAAGAQGVQVVTLGCFRGDDTRADEGEGLRVLGQLGLEDGASSNMVKAKGDVLVVAAGRGGVKLVAMQFVH
jgi:hypothetical protein